MLNGDAPGLDLGGARTLDQAEIDSSSTDLVAVDLIDQDPAYILYTSGSTGDPKGVMFTHRAALAFVSWAAEEFEITPTDRLSSHALHFDLSVFDLYAAAYAGAAVALVPAKASLLPNQVVRFIQENGITVWYSVPSILSMVTLRGGLAKTSFPSLRTVLLWGGLPDQVSKRADAAGSPRPFCQPLWAYRDQRLHLV